MQVFINERSLHGQFAAHNIEDGIRNFLQALKTLNEVQAEKRIYTSKLFFNYQAISRQHLGGILATQRDLQQTFFGNIRNAVKWEDEQAHELARSYTYNAVDYVTTSVAEITERLIRTAQLNGLLINFTGSIFHTLVRIDVQKQGGALVPVDCSFDEDSVTKWLIDKGFIDPTAAYSPTSHIPPKDYQSVLKDTDQFTVTAKRNQGRKVYKRTGSTELWVIDNLHVGGAAHIEVFNENTLAHIGTSSISAINVETKYRDPDKYLS